VVEPPAQKEVDPEEVTDAEGVGFTVSVTGLEAVAGQNVA
jgi:hypothetical protein